MSLPRGRWDLILLTLLGLHLALGIGRIVPKVWGKRLKEIAEFRDQGPLRYYLGGRWQSGAEAVEAVLAQAGPASVVLWRGDWAGSLEFAPQLLAPRLLVAEYACLEGTDTMHGLPVARGRLADGREGTFVLVGRGDDIELTIR